MRRTPRRSGAGPSLAGPAAAPAPVSVAGGRSNAALQERLPAAGPGGPGGARLDWLAFAPAAHEEPGTAPAVERLGSPGSVATRPASSTTARPELALEPEAAGVAAVAPAQAGPSAAALAGHTTAAVGSEVDSAVGAVREATAAETESATEDAVEQTQTQTQAEAQEAAAEAAAAEAATERDGPDDAALDQLVVGEDISLADTLQQRPEALAAMGLEQYASDPAVGLAAAEAIRTGDWKKLQEAGLSEDEAKAVFNTVEAVRIGVENSSHEVSFAEGTVIDDKVGRDEIVLPGVKSFDEVEQRREGDDLLLSTAEGEVRVVGYYDRSRGNVARIRLADAESDDHGDTTIYRDEMMLRERITRGELTVEGGAPHGPDSALPGMGAAGLAGGAASTLADFRSPEVALTQEQEAIHEARNNAMYSWGTGQTQDVRTLMFGAADRDNAQLVRGHNKVLGGYSSRESVYDPRSQMAEDLWIADPAKPTHRQPEKDGAAAIGQGDRALQDLAHFNSLDEEGKKKHIRHIAKKGEKSSFLGKVLGIVGTVASFIPGIGQVVGAVLTGLSVVVQGGSLLDGIKAGLGSYLAGGGGLGGLESTAATRLAGSALAGGGDPASMAMALVGERLQGTTLGQMMDDHNLALTGQGLSFAPGGGPMSIHVGGDGELGAGLRVDQVSVNWSEGGELSLGVTRDDWTGTVTDEGAVSLAHNLGDIAGEDTTTWAGMRYDPGTGFAITGNQVETDGLFQTTRWGSIDLETGDAQLETRSDASLLDVFDETFGHGGEFIGLWPAMGTDLVTVPTTESPGMTAEEVLAEHAVEEPDTDFSAPEATGPNRHDPAGPMEEVVVVGQDLSGLHTVPGGHGPGAGRGGGGGGELDAVVAGPGTVEVDGQRLQSVADIAAATTKAAAYLAEIEQLEASGHLLGGSKLATGVRKLAAAMAAAEQEVAETGAVSPQTLAEIADATSMMRDGLESAVGVPKHLVTRVLGRATGIASSVATLMDDEAGGLDKINAVLGIVADFVPPASPVGMAIATFDASTSIGTAARELALTTPVYDILYDTAEQASASLDAAGDATEQFFSEAGGQATELIEELTGVEVGDTVQSGFDALGATADRAFDAVAGVADDIIVIGGAVQATVLGVVWAGVDAVSGGD